MEFNELIRDRFSCRALSDREIPHDVLGRIFEAARLAPTAVNKQPFKVWAIQSPDARAKLAEATNSIPSVPASFLSSEEKQMKHGCAPMMNATSPMSTPPSSRRTSCSPSTTRASARHGSDTSTHRSCRKHSPQWRTMISSRSSPSATRPRRGSPLRVIRSARAQRRSWRSSE